MNDRPFPYANPDAGPAHTDPHAAFAPPATWDAARSGQFGAPPARGLPMLGIVALCVGGVAFLSGWIAFVGGLLGLAAIVLAIVALAKRIPQRGFMAIPLTLGMVAVAFNLVVNVLWLQGFNEGWAQNICEARDGRYISGECFGDGY